MLLILRLIVVCIVLLTSMRSVWAAEWQWSVPDDKSRAFLWIPPECQRVRAVIVANHNMIEQGILEHATMRQTLARLGIAEIWVTPYLDIPFDFRKGAGEKFDRIVNALADASGYQELKVAPVIPLGHSACATFPWNFAAWNPSRTLCILSVHGDAPQTHLTGYGRANVDWGENKIDGIPGLMVMGEYEWWEDRLTPAFTFTQKNPNAPVAFLADAGNGHFDYSNELVSFLAMFIQKSTEQRLPENHDDEKTVLLRPVNPSQGWRIDRWRKDAPASAPAASWNTYMGNTHEAFWCFDKQMAEITESYYARQRGKKPQLIGVYDTQNSSQGGCGEPVTPKFLPQEDGVTFHLSAKFMDTVTSHGDKATRWTGLPANSPLGHATAGGPIDISWIVGPAIKKNADTFVLSLNRSNYAQDRRNNDIWLVARHPGDEQYKSIVQQLMVRVPPNLTGKTQTLHFPAIPDQKLGTQSVKLSAVSDAGLPVNYYVLEGPAYMDDQTLVFTSVPPRSKFPIRVTVVAWQWGRSSEPQIQTAKQVEISFLLVQ